MLIQSALFNNLLNWDLFIQSTSSNSNVTKLETNDRFLEKHYSERKNISPNMSQRSPDGIIKLSSDWQ
jgi:hypothetical protein